MKKTILISALATLFIFQNAIAEVSVVSNLPTPDTCDEEGRRCERGSNGLWVSVYTSAEMDAKHGSFNERFAQLVAENGTLRSQIDQREKDIRTLSNKADLADARYLELIKLVNELSGKVPPLTPRIRKPRQLSNSK